MSQLRPPLLAALVLCGAFAGSPAYGKPFTDVGLKPDSRKQYQVRRDVVNGMKEDLRTYLHELRTGATMGENGPELDGQALDLRAVLTERAEQLAAAHSEVFRGEGELHHAIEGSVHSALVHEQVEFGGNLSRSGRELDVVSSMTERALEMRRSDKSDQEIASTLEREFVSKESLFGRERFGEAIHVAVDRSDGRAEIPARLSSVRDGMKKSAEDAIWDLLGRATIVRWGMANIDGHWVDIGETVKTSLTSARRETFKNRRQLRNLLGKTGGALKQQYRDEVDLAVARAWKSVSRKLAKTKSRYLRSPR